MSHPFYKEFSGLHKCNLHGNPVHGVMGRTIDLIISDLVVLQWTGISIEPLR